MRHDRPPTPPRALPSLLLLGALALALGCSRGGNKAPLPARLEVFPARVTVAASASQVFTARLDGAATGAVTWSVANTAGGAVSAAQGGTVRSGLYTAPAASGTFWVVATSTADPTKQGHATVTVSAPACGGVGQACCAGGACSAGTCSGGTCVADETAHVEYAVDPIAQPGAGELNVVDQASSPLLVQDRSPAGSGDLLGLFLAGGSAYTLLLSTDGGQSWRYLPASGGTPPALAAIGAATIAQDTVGYALHWITFPAYGSATLYHRAALAHAGGHVSGWSWETADRPGPAFAAGSHDPFPKLTLAEVVDAGGDHLLALAGVDSPAGLTRRLLAARTRPGAAALAPASLADWGQLTDGGGASSTLGAWYPGAAGGAGLRNFAGADPVVDSHVSTVCLAQSGDGALHVFTGTFFYNDTDAHGDLTRWRLTRGTSGWTTDPSATGATVAAAGSSVRPSMGSCVGTAQGAWLTWGDATGLHVGRVALDGGFAPDALPSPDPTPDLWWYAALGAADTGEAWLMWERNPGNHDPVEQAAYWDGATWTVRNDTALWARNGGWAAGGAANWTPIGRLAGGVGVMAYGYGDWGGPGPDRYSVHVYR